VHTEFLPSGGVNVRHVGVPNGLSSAEISNWPAIFDDIRYDVDLGKFLTERLAVRVRAWRIEFAEAPAKSKKLGIRKMLSADQKDEPLPPLPFDRIYIGLSQ
jgi:hypothetical protein